METCETNVAFYTTHNRKTNHHNLLDCTGTKVEPITPIHLDEFINFIMKQPFAHNEK